MRRSAREAIAITAGGCIDSDFASTTARLAANGQPRVPVLPVGVKKLIAVSRFVSTGGAAARLRLLAQQS